MSWRRPLIGTHRWLGILGGVLFILWFASGIVMLYARMPGLTAEERLARLPPLDLSSARFGPADIADRLEFVPERLRVSMLGRRPVYRFAAGGRWQTVLADSGERLEALSPQGALNLVRTFMPEHAATARYVESLSDADMWTLVPDVRRLRPRHRIALGDPDDTYVHVADSIGEVVMQATGRERLWAYAGAIPHWLYFPALRRAGWWASTVLWLSAAGCLLSMTGLLWGLWQFSPLARDRRSHRRALTPYGGLMRWHHFTGLAFGTVTFTWIFSSLLSMGPLGWAPETSPTIEQQRAVSGGTLRLEQVTLERLRQSLSRVAVEWDPKELEVIQFQESLFALTYRAPWVGDRKRWKNTDVGAFLSLQLPFDGRLVDLVDSSGSLQKRFDDDTVAQAATAVMPGTRIAESRWLDEYDAYYYHRFDAQPLPVLRVRYDDPEQTWLYYDPGTGSIVHRVERRNRLNRWLFNGLHSLDFPWLYHRPWWDVVIIALSVGGLVVCLTSFADGWRRLRRHARRLFPRDVLSGSRVSPTLRGERRGIEVVRSRRDGPAVSGPRSSA